MSRGRGSPGQHRTRVGTVTGTDHWARATAGLPAPLVVVDLDAFDANADDLVARAGGLPIRVASKSVRCRTLLDRVLARAGLRRGDGVRRARGGLAGRGRGCATSSWPTRQRRRGRAAGGRHRRPAARRGDGDHRLRRARALAARHPRGPTSPGWASRSTATRRCGWAGCTSGCAAPRPAARSRRWPSCALRSGSGLDVRGVMFYDAQVAGLPDAGPHVRTMKRRSVRELR